MSHVVMLTARYKIFNEDYATPPASKITENAHGLSSGCSSDKISYMLQGLLVRIMCHISLSSV